MSKHTYVNGDFITPTILNQYFGVDSTSGHIHDGTDADGHAPLINLTTNVQGPMHINSDATVNTLSSARVLSSYIDCGQIVTNVATASNAILATANIVTGNVTGVLTAPKISGSDATFATIDNTSMLTLNGGTLGTQIFGGVVDIQANTGRVRLYAPNGDIRFLADGTMALAVSGIMPALQIVGLNAYADNTAAKAAYGGFDNWVYRQGDFLAITHS
jgi:hypothetical protein